MKGAIELLKEALDGIDIGGEQSRAFAAEIRMIRAAIRILRKKKGGKRGSKSTHNN